MFSIQYGNSLRIEGNFHLYQQILHGFVFLFVGQFSDTHFVFLFLLKPDHFLFLDRQDNRVTGRANQYPEKTE